MVTRVRTVLPEAARLQALGQRLCCWQSRTYRSTASGVSLPCRMPWSPACLFDFDERIAPSFLQNNLASDGRGRFAFAHGGRVQCTRRSTRKQQKNDFTLAMRAHAEVTQVFWWQNVPGFSRPLLVLATDSAPNGTPASVQVWDTRSGRGACVFAVSFDKEEKGKDVLFARGLGSATSASGSPVLFVGLSTGDVYGYEVNSQSRLVKTCTLTGLTAATVCVAGDKRGSAYIAGSDEHGNLMAWTHGDERWTCVYKYRFNEDYCCALGIRGRVLIAGHASGKVSFHDLFECRRLSEAITNAKKISCLDVHPSKDLLLVAGEDCRATVLMLPTRNGQHLNVVLSVYLNAIVCGGCFTCLRPDSPDITMLLWERTQLVQYSYVEKRATGQLCD